MVLQNQTPCTCQKWPYALTQGDDPIEIIFGAKRIKEKDSSTLDDLRQKNYEKKKQKEVCFESNISMKLMKQKEKSWYRWGIEKSFLRSKMG